ncbi:MAG: homoserine kinase [Chloroflexota bacterium]
MTVRTLFSSEDFIQILTHYDLGTFVSATPISQGTVQTNYIVNTTQHTFVFRRYENRSEEAVLFELNVLTHLMTHQFPCPYPIQNKQAKYNGLYHGKPYALFTFIEGQSVEGLNKQQAAHLIRNVATLHNLTINFQPVHMQHRWNYSPDFCQYLAEATAKKIDTPDAYQKLAWLENTLSTLQLPLNLPKGICHCDLDLSNIFFHGDKFVALLDFDDANYTYLLFDLVCLIESFAWHYTEDYLDFVQALGVTQTYQQHRTLTHEEQRHLYDVYKLSILIDCIWFFERGSGDHFYEKQKIDALLQIGREQFVSKLFPKL